MKIAAFGNYGVQNIGDDLILMGLMKKYKYDELIVFCGNPQQVKKQFELQTHMFFPGGIRSTLKYIYSKKYRKQLRRAFQDLKKADKVLIGGGGILVDKHLKAVFLWWRQLRAIWKSASKYEFVANSIELKHWWSKMIFKKYLKRAQEISVRDKKSQRLLKSMGIKSQLVKDLACELSHKLSPQKNLKTREKGSPRKRSQKKICLSLCKWGLKKKQKEALKEFIKQRRQEGYKVVALAFQSQKDDDRKILSALDPELEIKTELQDILNELNTASLLIGMRFHSLLLAESLEVPTIALAYQDKVSSFMDDQAKPELCIPIKKLDQAKLQELFEKAICN